MVNGVLVMPSVICNPVPPFPHGVPCRVFQAVKSMKHSVEA